MNSKQSGGYGGKACCVQPLGRRECCVFISATLKGNGTADMTPPVPFLYFLVKRRISGGLAAGTAEWTARHWFLGSISGAPSRARAAVFGSLATSAEARRTTPRHRPA